MATPASNGESWIDSDRDMSDGSDGDSFTSSSESSAGEGSGNFPWEGVGHSTKTTTGHGNAFSHPPHHINKSKGKKTGRRKGSPRAPPPPPRQKATVKELAEEKAACHAKTDVEAHILDRIRKCLDRANHPTTPEIEAKAALHMSSRLMAQYNVTQADVLAQAADSEQQKQYAGQSNVAITSTKGPFAKVISQTWVHRVAAAMEVFFDCKTYSTARTWSIEWTFYGIAPNTAAAAISFEMAHNLILEWAKEKKGVINSYCLGVGQGLWEMAKEEKRREEGEARKREQDTLSARLKEEELQRQKELDRLNNDVGMPDEQRVSHATGIADYTSTSIEAPPDYDISHHDGSSSDSDDDTGRPTFNDQFDEAVEAEPTFREEEDALPLDPEADFEVELQRILKREGSCTPVTTIKPEPSSPQSTPEEAAGIKPKLEEVKPKLEEVKSKFEQEVKPKLEEEDDPCTETSLWTSASQLTLFRATANKIAEEYLKSTGEKLGKGRARVSSVRDYGAYEQGRKDSRKIDVKRRRIE
jgi:hypothetical protein